MRLPGPTIPVLTGLAVLIIAYWFSLPEPLFQDPLSTVLEDREGRLMGARIAEDGQWRFPSGDPLPDKYVQSVTVFEDQYFFRHFGVNPLSVLRAAWQNLRAGEIVSGGSTLSMQVIRLSRKGRPRSLPEKLIEMLLAVRLEIRYSKKDILQLYASNAPFGGNVVGLEAASWRYFDRAPADLSWAETATLAVLPNAPGLIHPGMNRSALEKKRNRLLDRLAYRGIIDSVTRSLAILEPLPGDPQPLPALAPHLLDHCTLMQPGTRIRSSLLADLQGLVNGIIREHHQILSANQVHNAACLVLDTKTGQALAYVGNAPNPPLPEFGPSVDLIRAERSTGSILKPLLFTLMLEEGEILPGTLVPDIPTQYTGYTPKNFNLGYDGAVPARRALARSLNIPAVRMLQSHGLEKFYHQLQSLGFQSLRFPADHYGLSLILGGAEGNLWEITGMYASMGRILNAYPSDAYEPAAIHPPVYTLSSGPGHQEDGRAETMPYSAASVWLTFQSLIEVNRPDSQFGWQRFGRTNSIAWKTGTSFGFRDAWAIGTTPAYTVGVWAGNADGEGRPGLTGIAAASPILFDVFGILPASPWFNPPLDELHPVEVCRQSGHLPGPHCCETDTVLVPRQGLQSPPCPYHRIVHLSPDRRFQVSAQCRTPDQMRHESWFVLPPVQEWYYKQRNLAYRVLPPVHPGCEAMQEIPDMEMLYPRHSARVYVPRELDGSKGKVILEAAHRDPSTLIHWHLNDRYLGSTRYIHQMNIAPVKGSYRLTLVDEQGKRLVRDFLVIDH